MALDSAIFETQGILGILVINYKLRILMVMMTKTSPFVHSKNN